jgi:enamine deaminase RidA (YjgF/YER057c/UK114 family)
MTLTAIAQKLAELDIKIPTASAPVANYVGFTITEKTIFISGQLPIIDGKISFIGKVGESISTEQAKEASKYCAINVLAQLQSACNSKNITLDDIKQCVKLSIFVNAEPNFTQHSEVANGASDLMVKIFGEKGKHIRASVGCGSLPFGVAVEVEAIFQIN